MACMYDHLFMFLLTLGCFHFGATLSRAATVTPNAELQGSEHHKRGYPKAFQSSCNVHTQTHHQAQRAS